ncbi:outer membrane beta-barrel protein [Botryobacter ruber]|uniref:outer membrane beta-barrel protein n=1 Tax=Botryobacter ruber TaxID=2171629 RepID=UPI001F0C60BF|nr:outer membrane beta-barrel protein [Botryobacter ruber]
MKHLLLLLVFMAGFFQVHAQGQRQTVYGTVQSQQDNTTLPGASVVLTKTADGTTTGTATDPDGKFKLEGVTQGEYTLKVNYIGFTTLTKTIRVQNAALNLGTLQLESEAKNIKEVEVVGRVPLGEQKGDTTQFNAKAFKTAPDASAEDLVTKMPGVTVQNGTIQAQGEDIKQVMIDGKRYVGEDVNSAMRNLSSDMIESVQIFDGQSDRAAFSGFDDGNRVKTINFTTRRDRRQGYTGKASAAYGTNERYMVGAAVNYFNNNRRITFTGLTNNINMFDFSVGETPGGGMRGRRGGWGRSSPNGIINTNNIGLNYNDNWGKKMEVAASYNFSRREINNSQYSFEDFLNIDQTQTTNRVNLNTEESHRLNFRLQYNINENNRLLITPNISLQNDYSTINALTVTETSEETIGTSVITNKSDNASLNFNNNVLYSHRFGESGRIFTANLNTNVNNADGDEFQFEDTKSFVNQNGNKYRDQYFSTDRNSFSWSGNVNYSQFINNSKTARLQLEYNISNQRNDNDRIAYNRLADGSQYTDTIANLSNSFESNYLAHSIGPSYQYRTDKVRFQVNTLYQYATLENDATYPLDYDLKQSFGSVLPSAEYEYKFTNTRNLRLEYRSSTNVPSADQLQDVLNLANPVQPRIGNPNLEQDFQHRFTIRFRNFSPETSKNFFMGVFGTLTQDAVVNSVYMVRTVQPGEEPAIPTNNPEVRAIFNNYEQQTGNFLLDRPGARLIRPVNMDGNWNVRSFFNYGQPVNFISSSVNINGGVGFSRNPGMINDTINFASTTSAGVGLHLSSNISEKVDFNISTNASKNFVRNTIPGENTNYNYFSQNTSVRLNWIIWKGLVYRTELAHQFNQGLARGVDPNFTLWNMSIGKKLLKNQQAEISLSVNDLLNENTSISRNVSSFSVVDTQSTVLQRFFMLTFSYNIRSFAGAAPPDENNRGDRPGGYRGGR